MDTIAVLDFGGQYAHLIANRIRRLGAYSEIVDNMAAPADLARYKGIVLSGGPRSVTEEDAPGFDPRVLDLGVPVLGLCYGHQLICLTLGGMVERGQVREYGIAHMSIVRDDPFFAGLDRTQQIWMSHGDTVTKLPPHFDVLGSTPDCERAAVRQADKPVYGLQFHPEVTDTPNGLRMLDNFLSLCGCARQWNPTAFREEIERQVLKSCAGRRVFLLVSGGVDSTVAFLLLNNLLGADRVLGLHIDNGLMRKDESADVMAYMREHGFTNLRVHDASQQFLDALAGVVDPERKREIIGNTFIAVQRAALAGLGLNAQDWILGQGTIYPDTIESAGTKHADRIKTHHNRVDIVRELMDKGLVVEPLAQLYKDEVRMLGEALGLPRSLVWRHPFPGPGLGVRVLCSDGIAPETDPAIGRAAEGLCAALGYTATVLPVRSVGVQGDERTYARPVLLAGPRNWRALEELSTRITNGVAGVNRVLFGVRTSAEGGYRLIRAGLSRQRLDLLREIDSATTAILVQCNQYDSIWQMPVVLLPLVNSRGEQCVVLRPITSTDAMTARFAPLRDDVLAAIGAAARGIAGIGDVFLDITHKPPGTIEWE